MIYNLFPFLLFTFTFTAIFPKPCLIEKHIKTYCVLNLYSEPQFFVSFVD